MSIAGKLLSRYDAADWLLKQKARTLLLVVSIGMLAALVDGVLTSLFLGRIAPTVYSDTVLLVMSAVTLLLLVRGRYIPASTLASIAILFGLCFSRYLSTCLYASDPAYDVSQNAVNLMLVIVFTALIAERYAQLAAMIVISIIVTGGYGVALRARVLPASFSTYDSIFLSKLLFVSLTGLMTSLLFFSNRAAVRVARSEARASRSNEENFRTIFNSVNDAIFVHDIATGTIVDVNDRMCEMYRVTRTEALTNSVGTMSANIPPYTDRDAEACFFRARTEGPQLFEWLAKDSTGRTFWVEVNMRRAVIGPEERILVVVRDISQRKAADERITAYTVELERSNRELKDFAFAASHDLQEPLRKVRAFGDLLATRFGAELNAEGREYIAYMQSSTERMQTLISDLLAYSRIGAVADYASLPLDTALDDALVLLEQETARSKAIITRTPLPSLMADRGQMRQLFQNLISNALKFRKPDIPPHITIASEVDGDHAVITVSDNGIGFDKQYTDKIFVIFQRLHGRSEFSGTGIGLAICKKIIETLGGTIRAESTVGEGSRFIIRLPLTRHDRNNEG